MTERARPFRNFEMLHLSISCAVHGRAGGRPERAAVPSLLVDETMVPNLQGLSGDT
jgi:hypothetical protein